MSKQLSRRRDGRRLSTITAVALCLAVTGASEAFSAPVPAASAAPSTAGGPTLSEAGSGPLYQGQSVTFDYSTPAANLSAKNWVGIYPAGVKPGSQGSTLWQYTPNANGTVSFDTTALTPGAYDVYYLYNDGYTSLAGPVPLTVQADPAPQPPTTPPTAPNTGSGPNLIVNGDAEQGEGSQVGVDTNTVPGWKVTGLLNSVAYGAQGGEGIANFPTPTTTGPKDRGRNFFSGGGGGTSTATQTADVRAAAKRIDRGTVTYNLTGWLGGSGVSTDNASVTSTFLNAKGRALGTATLGPVTPQMRKYTTELLPEQAVGKIPAGTRSIRTVLTITGPQPHDRRGHAQGYADNLSLKISAPVPAPRKATAPKADVPGYDHVFVVMLENQDYNGIIGNKTAAPYINSLVPKGANLTNAVAETHPSDPNYVALAGGSLFNVNDNTPFSSTVNAPHIGDLVTKAGGTWRGYMENANGSCDTTGHGAYTIDDLPFYFFKDVKDNPANCQAHLKPLTQLSTDLRKTSTTPTFSWLSADDCDDMEGCGVTAGDTWLSRTLPTIFDSPAWKKQRSLLVLTWDEDAADGQQQLQRIPTIVLGSQGVRAGATSNVRYTHYSVLRTIEAALHLPSLTKNDLYAEPVNDIWTRPGRRR
ncbi:alkaline phosphatase family protein [Streptomyces silvisoli]|uniref:Alkaline phosphatase family protein n=1 Tax=Streptomyces silvisoli TaxID=3034235 RepID=A0ABT5ZEB8_9ACTN|nr:alkaline phosphatase family protein [Streptomyces silvisoli]MDF3287950.1 alkaline phosphatase family protein [Streptomyces silvisoli]